MYILFFVGCCCCPPGFSVFLASSLDVPSWFPFLVFQKACFQLSCSSFILFLPTFLFCIFCLRGSVQSVISSVFAEFTLVFVSSLRHDCLSCSLFLQYQNASFSLRAEVCFRLISAFFIVFLHCALQGFISSPLSLFPMFRSSSLLLSSHAISEHCHFSFCFCLPTLIDDP